MLFLGLKPACSSSSGFSAVVLMHFWLNFTIIWELIRFRVLCSLFTVFFPWKAYDWWLCPFFAFPESFTEQRGPLLFLPHPASAAQLCRWLCTLSSNLGFCTCVPQAHAWCVVHPPDLQEEGEERTPSPHFHTHTHGLSKHLLQSSTTTALIVPATLVAYGKIGDFFHKIVFAVAFEWMEELRGT